MISYPKPPARIPGMPAGREHGVALSLSVAFVALLAGVAVWALLARNDRQAVGDVGIAL